MDTQFTLFEKFAKERLKQPPFETKPDSKHSRLFHTSLLSALHLCQWTQGARDQQGQKFELVAGYVDTFTPNALADWHNDVHFIAMHSALFGAINEFAMFCFTQAEFFPDVGNPSIEQSPSPWNDQVPGIWLMDHTKRGEQVEERHRKHLSPNDVEREHMALYLTFLMSRFVWLHELAHCFNGHVALVQHKKLALRLYEISEELSAIEVENEVTAAKRREILKCLEFDADQSALWASCNIQLHDLENIEGIRQLDSGLRMRLTLFGAFAMTWLFEQFQDYLDTQNGNTHPAPFLRLSYLLQTAKNEITPLHEDLRQLNEDVLEQFDRVRARIPSLYSSTGLFELFRGGAENTELSSYNEKMAEQKKVLETFQYSEDH